ncbi:DUF2975 domain-containing protein [Streptomyces sp. NBC_00433]
MRSPLEPMAGAVRAIVTLFAVLAVGAVLGSVLVHGAHPRFLGIGDSSFCVPDTSTTVGGNDPALRELAHAPGAVVVADAHPSYCTDDPGTAQSLLHVAKQLPPFVFTVGALLLVFRLIRGAEGADLYTTRTAQRLRALGWWLLAGSVLSAIAVSVAGQALVDSLDRGGHAGIVGALMSWDVPFMAILTGLGVLSFARVMRVGVTMREDLDGTV